MGEQDALPSTQDAFAESDVALATLPEVVISPQVTSGKVIDALRQFLPREVMVEVVERVETESQIAAAAAISAAHGEADESALPAEAVAAGPAVPMAIEMPATIDLVAETSPVIPAVMPAPVPILPAKPTRPLASTSSAPAAQARRKRKVAPALPVAAPVTPSPTTLAIAASDRPCPTASTSSPAAQPRPCAAYSGSLPYPKIDDAYRIEGTARRSASPGWLTRLSRWLMPDVVGRLIQHPVLSILTGIGFGLLVLRWLLGQ